MTRKKIKKTQHSEGVIPTLLIILDGFGLRDFRAKGNAITPDTAPNILGYMSTFASTTLKAHGKHVGLFTEQQGNSEAGHFNIGAGRIVKQDLVRISEAIADGTFFKNEAFEQALFHAKKYKRPVHVFGLLTNGNSAHAHPKHLYAMLDFFRKKKQKQVYLHLFTDGRDSPPHSAVTYLKKLRGYMKNGEQIASIMGRYYAMDRNKLWERTKQAYDLLVLAKGACGSAESAEQAISQAYNRGETDEYICPTVIVKSGKPVATIGDNDAIFFINARSDRARQLTKAFVQQDFQKKNPGAFKRSRRPKNIRFVAMTDFGPDLPGIFTAYPSPDIVNSLPCAIGDFPYKQLYISETEKYAHVTYFVNGGYANTVCGEERLLLQSSNVKSFKKEPAMHAKAITKTILEKIKKEHYTFVTVNFANADMVGHTGDFEAAKKAVKAIDTEVAKLVAFMVKRKGQVVITADHGNAECMINEKTGEMMTEHTTNPVPFIVVRKGFETQRLKKTGKLADVAPTLLKLMHLEQPKEMTGNPLF